MSQEEFFAYAASLGLPVPSSMLTPADAQKEARERSTEVLAGWNQLREILDRHEDLLRTRWTKKNKSQRTSILQQAWPNMPCMHRPDYEAWRKDGSNFRSVGTTSREAYLWPYINVEDLVRPKTLLLFLNSRGRYAPYIFAHTDFEATNLGRVTGIIAPAFLNLHTMLLEGELVETYGRLVAWDDEEEAMIKVFTGREYQPGEALMILEIQQRILRFLVDCCHIILHDFTPRTLIAEAPIKPEPAPLIDRLQWPTWASITAEAPYRVPAQLDFNRLKVLIATKRNDAEDYIQNLREDPSYFADVVEDWSEHRQEKLLDTNGARHPVLGKPLFWNRVLGNVILDAYMSLIIWDIISEQLSQLATLQDKYSNVLLPQNSLPSEYMKALLTLRYTLSQAKKGPISNLKTGIPASPHFRSLWVREPPIPGSSIIRLQTKKGSDRTMWLFNTLWTEDQLRLLGFPALINEIENTIQINPQEKTRLSDWTLRIFSDLGLIARVRHELDIYQPWASTYEHEFIKYQDGIEKDFQQRLAAFVEVERNLSRVSLAELGEPVLGRFYYPSEKRRTKQTTESMQKAENNLDMFWKKVDGYFREKLGSSLDETVFAEKRPLKRTTEWVEPVQDRKSNLSAEDKHALQNSLPIIPHASADSSQRFVPPELKSKSKTRGLAQDSSATALAAYLPGENTEPQRIIVLKSRAFKVFQTLFFNPSNSNLPGEVPWTDFLYAMEATGFAIEKLHGSAWQFTPLTGGVEQSIQFHEPHPVAKIPFLTARGMGRRLSRTYGWHGSMFTLG